LNVPRHPADSKTIAEPRLQDFDITCTFRRLFCESAYWDGAEPERRCADEDANPYTYLANGWVDGEQDFKYKLGESLPWTKYLSDM